jgi:hypothetical protein
MALVYGYMIIGEVVKMVFMNAEIFIALKNLSDTLQIMYSSFDKIIDSKGKLILCAPWAAAA